MSEESKETKPIEAEEKKEEEKKDEIPHEGEQKAEEQKIETSEADTNEKPLEIPRSKSDSELNKKEKKPKKDINTIKKEQKNLIDNLLNELSNRYNQLTSYEGNDFYEGFKKFYAERLDYISTLDSDSSYMRFSVEEYKDNAEFMKGYFTKIEKALNEKKLDEAQNLINMLNQEIETIENEQLRHYCEIQRDNRKNKWQLKIDRLYLYNDFSNDKLKKAYELYQNTNDVVEPLKIVTNLLRDQKLDRQTKRQANQLNNMLISYRKEQDKDREQTRLYNGKINLMKNDNINKEIEDLYNTTRDHVDSLLEKYDESVIDDPKNVNNSLIKECQKYIQQQLITGMNKLDKRTKWIEAAAIDNSDRNRDMSELKNVEDWFIGSLNQLQQMVAKKYERVVIASIDNKRNELLQTNIDELNNLLNNHTYGIGDNKKKISNGADFYRQVTRLSTQIYNEIHKQVNDIDDKLSDAETKEQKESLINQRNKLLQQERIIKEKCNNSKLELKIKFQEMAPNIIERMQTADILKEINTALHELMPDYNEKTPATKPDTKIKDVQEEAQTKEDLPNAIKELIKRLQEAKMYFKGKFNIELGTEYKDEINRLYDVYFDSRINSLQNILSDISENKLANDKETAIDKAEEIVNSYEELEDKIEKCNIPSIYKYYHEHYFNFFNKSIRAIKDEYDSADYTSVRNMGRTKDDYLKSRIQAIKHNMTIIMNSYQERYQEIEKHYNNLLEQPYSGENELIKKFENALMNLNINDLFKDYVEKKKNDNNFSYDTAINNLPSLDYSSEPTPQNSPQKNNH